MDPLLYLVFFTGLIIGLLAAVLFFTSLFLVRFLDFMKYHNDKERFDKCLMECFEKRHGKRE